MDTASSPSPLLEFLLRAKRCTYAASDDAVQASAAARPSSRPASHDLAYQEDDLLYLDSYLGGFSFGGQEAVWHAQQPLWAMNYYGSMTCEAIPDGFSAFLKQALRQVPAEAPYRGPDQIEHGPYTYICRWQGSPRRFHGQEEILLDGHSIYILYFHGGEIA